MNEINKFYRKLKNFRRVRITGLAISELIRTSGLALVLLVAYVVLDYFLSFEQYKLQIINIVLVAILFVYCLINLIKVFRISLRDTAKTLDSTAELKRHNILSAFELEKELNDTQSISTMNRFLISQSVKAAGKKLEQLTVMTIFPKAEFKRSIILFSIQLLIAIVVLGIPFRVTSIIMSRIFNPTADIPPYSCYLFNVLPKAPSVIYGGNLELTLNVTGKPVDASVLLHTRAGSDVSSAACFKENSTNYTQRVEKLTYPVEFCFSIGRARSKWHKIDVIMRPEIATAVITLIPPEYTHLPQHSVILGKDNLAILKGTKLALNLTSNRPLMSGKMQIKNSDGQQTTIKAEKNGSNSLKFTWQATANAIIKTVIRDVRGTYCAEPLNFRQQITPDTSPDVVITEPDSFILATPGVKLTIKGYAEDDLGIRQVNFIRSIVGYRDRMKYLGPELVKHKYDFSQTFDLNELGVLPGEIIELYAEAADFNPSMMGVATSDVIKIKIISTAAYAEMLRLRTRVENIFRRHYAMRIAFNRLKKQLNAMADALKNSKLARPERQLKLKALKKANAEAKKLLYKLSNDFPIYEMEKNQQQVFIKLLEQTSANEKILYSINSSDSNKAVSKKIATMLKSFASQQQAVAQMEQDMAGLEELAKLMNEAGNFKKLVMQQEYIVRRLKRFKLGNDVANSAMLKKMGEQEKKVTAALRKLIKILPEIARKLHSKHAKIKVDAIKFAQLAHDAHIVEKLTLAYKNALTNNGDSAYNHATIALERMRKLLNQGKNQCGKSGCPNLFSGMCNGKLPSNMRKTAKQMLNSILQQKCGNKQGQGSGQAGQGTGGVGGGNLNDGYSMNSSSMLNVPVIGPGRSSFAKNAGGHSMSRGKGAAGRGSGYSIASDAKEKITILDQQKTPTTSISLDEAPFKYRDAVKKYFSGE
jgi:hypothetical protein